jgi:hypothetical protein
MAIPFRSELAPVLVEFAEQHRGVRLGKMFGVPAIYVGRKLACCLMEEGILMRLPPDVAKREVTEKRAKGYSSRGRALGNWVMYEPKTAVAARRLAPTIEIAVRHIGERLNEDLTGVRRSTLERRTPEEQRIRRKKGF